MSSSGFVEILGQESTAAGPSPTLAARLGLGLSRLLWKEWAQLWPVFASLGVLGALMVVVIHTFSREVNDWAPATLSVTGLIVAMACVSVATLLFATEKETGTADTLQTTPLPPAALGIGKFIIGGVLLAGFAAIMTGLTWLYVGAEINRLAGSQGQVAIGFRMACLVLAQGYVYCCFISLLINRSLLSAILGIVFSLFMLALLGLAMPDWFGRAASREVSAGYWTFGFVGLASFLLLDLILASQWLSLGWSRQQQQVSTWWQSWTFRWTWSQAAFRLVWQTWRGTGTGFVIGVLLTFLALTATLLVQGLNILDIQLLGISPLAFSLALAMAIMGSFVFWHDQLQDQRLFFHQHCERPRLLWLCRNGTWLGIVALSATTVLGLVLASGFLLGGHFFASGFGFMIERVVNGTTESGNWNSDPTYLTTARMSQRLLVALVCCGLGFAAGQFWSMLCRIPVLGIALAFVSTLVLCGWAGLMNTLQLLHWWSAVPLGLALFFATWWYAPQWLNRQPGHAWWWKPVVAVFGTWAILLLIIPVARIRQVESVIRHETSHAAIYRQFASAGAVRASELYRSALNDYQPPSALPGQAEIETSELGPIETWPADLLEQFVVANESVVADINQAQTLKFCYPYLNGMTEVAVEENLQKLFTLFAARAELALRSDDLRQSWTELTTCKRAFQDCHSYHLFVGTAQAKLLNQMGRWANHPAQTLELLDMASEWERTHRLLDPSGNDKVPRNGMHSWYANFVYRDQWEQQNRTLAHYWTYLPHSAGDESRIQYLPFWERQRTRRLAELLTHARYLPPAGSELERDSLEGLGGYGAWGFYWLKSTFLPELNPVLRNSRSLNSIGNDGDGSEQTSSNVYFSGQINIFRIKLELLRFAAKRNRYPESLDELLEFVRQEFELKNPRPAASFEVLEWSEQREESARWLSQSTSGWAAGPIFPTGLDHDLCLRKTVDGSLYHGVAGAVLIPRKTPCFVSLFKPELLYQNGKIYYTTPDVTPNSWGQRHLDLLALSPHIFMLPPVAPSETE